MVRSVNGDVIACICTSMPQNMRDGLIDRLAACFEPDALQDTDTSASGGENLYQAIHFAWYNRHCTTVSVGYFPQRTCH